MSKYNPGIIFDASSSWNGFNHQGKLAIYFAIKTILEIYDSNLDKDSNLKNLSSYFIEIEYLEDFSLGRIKNGVGEYYYVHQVKNHDNNLAKNYDSALLGLAYHIKNLSSIKKAYLHTTTNINFDGCSIYEYVKKLIINPTYFNTVLSRINEARNDSSKKQELYIKKKGRPENFVVRLKEALFEYDNNQKKLDASNIDIALNALEVKIQKEISELKKLTDNQIKKIELYSYNISGKFQNYCEVDKIKSLIINEIKSSINKFGLPLAWQTEKYIENRYLYILGKLDEHIKNRDLNYPLYKDNILDRKIKLSQVYDWLTSNDFDNADEEFYQFKLKESFLLFSDKFCSKCKLKKCDSCLLVSAINKIGQFSKNEMKKFLTLTCPNNAKGLSFSTGQSYLSERKIKSPFFEGIRDIDISFEEDKNAITYICKDALQFILTTLEMDDDQDNEEICTDIIKNKELYELMMEYDSFISKNISCKSIQDEAMKLGKKISDNAEYNNKRKEHIAHLKDVSIVTLNDFKNML